MFNPGGKTAVWGGEVAMQIHEQKQLPSNAPLTLLIFGRCFIFCTTKRKAFHCAGVIMSAARVQGEWGDTTSNSAGRSLPGLKHSSNCCCHGDTLFWGTYATEPKWFL